jgi:hypothetical protein
VTVVLEDPVPGQPHVLSGNVADVSAAGMRLTMDTKLPIGTKVQIQVCVPDCQIDMITHGEVRWVQPRDEARWSIGCLLAEAIPQDVLETLAIHSVLDRRKDERKFVSYSARAKWELVVDPSYVTIINYSVGGCCILFPDAVENPPDRLMLYLSDVHDSTEKSLEIRIPMRVMWCELTEEGYAVGCAFLSRTGYLTLRGLLEGEDVTVELQKMEPTLTSTSSPRTRWRWVAIAATVLLALRGIEIARNWTTRGSAQRLDARPTNTWDDGRKAVVRPTVSGEPKPTRNVTKSKSRPADIQ